MRKPQRVKPKISPGGYVVLGLLLDGPRSGYDVVQLVERSVAHFWPVTKAHVYAELPRLAAAGLAVGSRVEQHALPDKVLFAATDSGRTAFRAWLASTEPGEPRLHHPLLLKLFFGEHLPPSALSDFLEKRERDVRRTIAAYTEILERGPSSPRRWALRYGILRLESELSFIDEVRAGSSTQALGPGPEATERDPPPRPRKTRSATKRR